MKKKKLEIKLHLNENIEWHCIIEFKSNLIQIQLSSYSIEPNSKKLIEFKYIEWNQIHYKWDCIQLNWISIWLNSYYMEEKWDANWCRKLWALKRHRFKKTPFHFIQINSKLEFNW
jgi:hypothetical protein